jgi:predicted GIY-YIG superfamily endonuclease
MEKQYYVYSMEAVKSITGQAYIGCSCDLKRRSRQHKKYFNLDYTPELTIISGPYSIRKQAMNLENDLREKNGWWREGQPQGKIGGAISGQRAKESGQFNAMKTSEFQRAAALKALEYDNHNTKQEHTCNVCNKSGKGPSMLRYHFKNCKHLKDKL